MTPPFRTISFIFLLCSFVSLPLFAQHNTFPETAITKYPQQKTRSTIEKDTTAKSTLPPHTDNFALVLQTAHQPSDDFVNEQDLNLEWNRKKFHLQGSYSFIYDPFSPEGSIEITPKEHSTKLFETEKRNIYRQHQATVNVGLDLSSSDTLIFTNDLTFSHIGHTDKTSAGAFNQEIHTRDKSQTFAFSQRWLHHFNSTTRLTTEVREDYQKTAFDNRLHQQEINALQKGEIYLPHAAAFMQLQHQNAGGKTSGEIRYSHLSGRDKTVNTINDKKTAPRFRYRENLWSARLTHQLYISKTQTIQGSIQLEGAQITKNSYSRTASPPPSVKKNTNLDFNYVFAYRVFPTAKETYKISLQKRIIRPTFNQQNPLQKIYQDLLYTAGNIQLKPTHDYKLAFKTRQKNWIFTSYAGYSPASIRPYYQLQNGYLQASFGNFKTSFKAGGKIVYKRHLVNDRWETHNSLRVDYAQIDKIAGIKPLGNKPEWEFRSEQTIHFPHRWSFGMDYRYQSGGKNNLIKRHSSQQLDLFIEKKIGNRLKIVIFGEDIFKTHRRWEEFFINDYALSRNINMDADTYGFSIRYSLEGKNYKHHPIPKPKGRLHSQLQ